MYFIIFKKFNLVNFGVFDRINNNWLRNLDILNFNFL